MDKSENIMEEYDLIIKGLLRIRIIDKETRIRRRIDPLKKHYSFYVEKSSKDVLPDLIIEFSKLQKDANGSFISGNSLFLKEDYIRVVGEHYKSGRWSFESFFSNGSPIRIRIDTDGFGRYYVNGNIIDFFIMFCLLRKENVLIHASGVTKNNNAYLFSSRGGGGKTTIALLLCQKGYSLLGDNYTIINDGKATGYPTQLNLFNYNVTINLSKKLRVQERISLSIRNYIFKISAGKMKFFLKVNPNRLFLIENEPINVRKAFILLNSPIEKKNVSCRRIEKEDFANSMVFNQMLEYRLFNSYIHEYAYYFPKNKLSNCWQIYHDALIKKLPNDCEYYSITHSHIEDCEELIREIVERSDSK
jgi:hypothetical protein